MKKSVLIRINPKWCEMIANGKKTVEVRKTKPKLDTPFKVYIYCTKDEPLYRSGDKFCCNNGEFGNSKVIGEFVCYKIDRMAYCGTRNNDIRLRLADENLSCKELDSEYLNKCQLSYSEIEKYSNGCDVYGWHISNLVIYDKPRELSEFSSGSSRLEFSNSEDGFPLKWSGMKRPPQSWCYVEEVE